MSEIAIAQPFVINVSQTTLDHINAKLALSNVGYAPIDDANWAYGTDAAYLSEFLNYWRDSYDWKKAERALNIYPQFTAAIHGLLVHFYHVRSKGHGFPIILTHGWPGSVLEYQGVIGPLLNAGYDVVVPTLPGYGFSQRPPHPITAAQIAGMWRSLMTDVLGYSRFGAQGGDWGSVVTSYLGSDHADVVAAIHINTLVPPPKSADEGDDMTAYRQRLKDVRARESAYMVQQMTKPQTIGLALSDSPLGFAAWVLEKFHGWGDTHGDIESRFSKDMLITNIMIYLVNDAVQSAIWLYRSLFTIQEDFMPVSIPTGIAIFPGDYMPPLPRSAVENRYAIHRWTNVPTGGHFAALEEPVAFAEDVIAFFDTTR